MREAGNLRLHIPSLSQNLHSSSLYALSCMAVQQSGLRYIELISKPFVRMHLCHLKGGFYIGLKGAF